MPDAGAAAATGAAGIRRRSGVIPVADDVAAADGDVSTGAAAGIAASALSPPIKATELECGDWGH